MLIAARPSHANHPLSPARAKIPAPCYNSGMSEGLSIADWLPAATVGASFTGLGFLKVYGLTSGIIGGGDKRAYERICGTCPSWSKWKNIAAICLFLAIGLGNFSFLAWLLFQ